MTQAETRAYAEQLLSHAAEIEARLGTLRKALADDRARLELLEAIGSTESKARAALCQEQIERTEAALAAETSLAERLRKDAADMLAESRVA